MDAQEMLGSRIHVKGKIQRVTFKEPNYQNGGFAIIRFIGKLVEGEIPDDRGWKYSPTEYFLTFSGPTPSLSMKTEYEVLGELTKHEKYGYQYKIIKMVESVSFESREDVEKFFMYILPEMTAKNIMATFEDPISVLENEDIDALTAVQGVGRIRARKIIDKYKETRLDSCAYVELFKYGLTRLTIEKLCERYGSAEVLVSVIKKDPYTLIYDVKGIGWNKADAIAIAGGIAKDDPRRIKAFIFYLLNRNGEVNGDTYMYVEDMLEYCYQQFPEIEKDSIGLLLVELAKEERVYIEKETRRIGLVEYRELEEKIAHELYRISTAEVRPVRDIERAIAQSEYELGFQYSEEQRGAIRSCLTQNISIVTALGGSGKTTCMKPVSRAIRANGQYAALCALSGKASLNLGTITGLEGHTIHRLLGFDPEENGFIYNKKNQLTYDMIILDEASMVDEHIFYDLLQAIPNGCKLVLVGDTGQLEPIGIGCVFHDIIESKKFAHTHLTKIFRQAQKSGVITESRRVYDEQQIVKPNFYGTEVRGELQDFKITTVKELDNVLYEVLKEYKHFLSDYNADPDDIMIVTGKRVIGNTSARKINECIQKIINPKDYPDQVTIKKKDGKTDYEITFKPGDNVRVTKNCYDTYDLDGNTVPVFNGNIGKIVEIDPILGMKVQFMQGLVFIPQLQYYDLELGYAITCHSAQGSGFPYVITVCDNGSYALLSKEWLYTAITRCKKFNTLIGQPTAIRRACSITGIKYKCTWLKELIVNLFENQGENS